MNSILIKRTHVFTRHCLGKGFVTEKMGLGVEVLRRPWRWGKGVEDGWLAGYQKQEKAGIVMERVYAKKVVGVDSVKGSRKVFEMVPCTHCYWY